MQNVKLIPSKLMVLSLIGAFALLGSGCMVVPYNYGYHGHGGYHGYHGYDGGYRYDRYRR